MSHPATTDRPPESQVTVTTDHAEHVSVRSVGEQGNGNRTKTVPAGSAAGQYVDTVAVLRMVECDDAQREVSWPYRS